MLRDRAAAGRARPPRSRTGRRRALRAGLRPGARGRPPTGPCAPRTARPVCRGCPARVPPSLLGRCECGVVAATERGVDAPRARAARVRPALEAMVAEIEDAADAHPCSHVRRCPPCQNGDGDPARDSRAATPASRRRARRASGTIVAAPGSRDASASVPSKSATTRSRPGRAARAVRDRRAQRGDPGRAATPPRAMAAGRDLGMPPRRVRVGSARGHMGRCRGPRVTELSPRRDAADPRRLIAA